MDSSIPDFEEFHSLLRWRDLQLNKLERGELSRTAYRRLIQRAALQYEIDARARLEQREAQPVRPRTSPEEEEWA